MSGGRFDYRDSTLANEIYDWKVAMYYGEDGFKQSGKAARVNPFEDKEMSEIIWDMFVVIHSYDWYKSGDADKENYLEDIKRFKDKWFGKTEEERLNKLKERAVEEFRESLEAF